MSQKTKKQFLGISGIGLIILLLFFVNAFVGNPVSTALAKKAAQQYIDTTYSNLNLQIQRCGYNFKVSAYSVFVQSNTSKDTVFSIEVNSLGKVLGDDYDFEVANNFTTYRRLEKELREMAEKLIGDNLDYDFDNIFLHFMKETDFTELVQDMNLDIHHPPFALIK